MERCPDRTGPTTRVRTPRKTGGPDPNGNSGPSAPPSINPCLGGGCDFSLTTSNFHLRFQTLGSVRAPACVSESSPPQSLMNSARESTAPAIFPTLRFTAFPCQARSKSPWAKPGGVHFLSDGGPAAWEFWRRLYHPLDLDPRRRLEGCAFCRPHPPPPQNPRRHLEGSVWGVWVVIVSGCAHNPHGRPGLKQSVVLCRRQAPRRARSAASSARPRHPPAERAAWHSARPEPRRVARDGPWRGRVAAAERG